MNVFPVTKRRDFDIILHRFAKEIQTASFLYNVVDKSSCSGNSKITIDEEGHVLNNPFLCLVLLEELPLIWIKEQVIVRNVQILTQQTSNLSLGPERIVTDSDGLRLLILLLIDHSFWCSFFLYIYFFLILKSIQA